MGGGPAASPPPAAVASLPDRPQQHVRRGDRHERQPDQTPRGVVRDGEDAAVEDEQRQPAPPGHQATLPDDVPQQGAEQHRGGVVRVDAGVQHDPGVGAQQHHRRPAASPDREPAQHQPEAELRGTDPAGRLGVVGAQPAQRGRRLVGDGELGGGEGLGVAEEERQPGDGDQPGAPQAGLEPLVPGERQQQRDEGQRGRLGVHRQRQEGTGQGGVAAGDGADREGGEEERQDVVEMPEADRDLDPHGDEGQPGDQHPLPQPLVVGAGAQEVVGGAAAGQHQDHQAQRGHQGRGEELAGGLGERVEQPGRQEADRPHLELGVVRVEVEAAGAVAGAALVYQLAAGAQVVPGEAAVRLHDQEPQHGPPGEQHQMHPLTDCRHASSAPAFPTLHVHRGHTGHGHSRPRRARGHPAAERLSRPTVRSLTSWWYAVLMTLS
ncbi:hypothetical protein GZL_05796 [Streptomyces sp. 769]|nr:hypothetical protein GZL_05796 [Streptomyces sp. 769]